MDKLDNTEASSSSAAASSVVVVSAARQDQMAENKEERSEESGDDDEDIDEMEDEMDDDEDIDEMEDEMDDDSEDSEEDGDVSSRSIDRFLNENGLNNLLSEDNARSSSSSSSALSDDSASSHPESRGDDYERKDAHPFSKEDGRIDDKDLKLDSDEDLDDLSTLENRDEKKEELELNTLKSTKLGDSSLDSLLDKKRDGGNVLDALDSSKSEEDLKDLNLTSLNLDQKLDLSSDENDDYRVKDDGQHPMKDKDIEDRLSSDLNTSDFKDNDTTTEAGTNKNWIRVNDVLVENGFASIFPNNPDNSRKSGVVDVDPMLVLHSIREIMSQSMERGDMISSLMKKSQSSVRRQSLSENILDDREEKIKALEQRQASLVLQGKQQKNSLKELEIELETEKVSRARDRKGYLLKLKQSEHRVHEKERCVEALQEKMDNLLAGMKQKAGKAKERFTAMYRRTPRAGANAKDGALLECIEMYENSVEKLQEQVVQLKAQNRCLNLEIRDKENGMSFNQMQFSSDDDVQTSSSFHKRNSRQSSHKFQSELLLRMTEARRDQETAAIELRERESHIMKKVNRIEKDLSLSHSRIVELEEENANLQLEVKARPSISAYRTIQKRLEKAEIAQATQSQALAEANDVNELRKILGTKVMMKRDKMNHTLHLNRLETVPKSVLLDVVQQVCRILNLSDLTLISPSIQKLCTVVKAVPRLEEFVQRICKLVREVEHSDVALEDVVPCVKKWFVMLNECRAFKRLGENVMTELRKRPFAVKKQREWDEIQVSGSRKPGIPKEGNENIYMTHDQVVNWVAELVYLERQMLTKNELYENASTLIEKRPDLLVNRIVSHLQYLFSIKSLQGVIPSLNSTYLFVTEMQSFLGKIREILKLPPNCTATTCCEAAIKEFTQTEKGDLKRIPLEDGQPTENYVVSKDNPNNVMGVAEVREMTFLMKELQSELGAHSVEDVLPRVKRLMIMLTESSNR